MSLHEPGGTPKQRTVRASKVPARAETVNEFFLQIILQRYPAHAAGLAREILAKFAPVHIS